MTNAPEQKPAPIMDPETNLPIGELGARFKQALEGKTAEKSSPPAAPAPEAPKADVKPAAKPKPIPDLKSAPALTEIEKPKPELETKEPAKGAKKTTPEFNFRALEAQKDELAKKNAEYESKMSELQSELAKFKTGDAPEVSNLKQELNKYQELVSRYYLEHDPRFQAAFDRKIEQSIAEAKEAVGPEVAGKVEDILRMPDGNTKMEQLKGIVDELDEFSGIGVRTAYNEIRRLNKERQAELAKAKENVTKIQEFDMLNKAEETKKAAQERQTHMEATLNEAANYLPEFRKVAGNEEYNKLVDENISNVRQVMSESLSPSDQARMAVWAVRGYRSAEREAAQLALIQKLQATIEKLQGVQPTMEGTPTTPAKQDVSIETMAARFREAVSGR